jgi:hypothetical protein
MSITIQGYSDDIIELSGDIEDEIPYDGGEPAVLVFSDGTVLEIEFNDDGMWKIALLCGGSGKYIREFECSFNDKKTYSDVVIIEGDIVWAGLTETLVRR